MATFAVKVHNGDEGEDLGDYEAPFLPRVGDPFYLYHPRLTGKGDHPFESTVQEVVWEAHHKSHKYAGKENEASVTVWLAEVGGGPTLYCDCTSEERERFGQTDGDCENCGREVP